MCSAADCAQCILHGLRWLSQATASIVYLPISVELLWQHQTERFDRLLLGRPAVVNYVSAAARCATLCACVEHHLPDAKQ